MSLDPQRPALSPDNPWPGLDPFDEVDEEYFHGRKAESAELLRQVRRELLTVLFGRSGLGKTSLLKAGLFPRLRKEDGLPVYLRLDHAEGAPALREQVFGALAEAAAAYRVQAARPDAGEGLWSFFHRGDAEFWNESHGPVTPVVVLDQFEEIFTLGQATETARARSAAFLAELGDLVENRPPEVVGQALEADPTAAERFDFKRATVKVVLAFREDFLAEMEGLKVAMPSLMYNRFRLLAMNGEQAYQVITKAGGDLVDDEVARRILRLAWKNEPAPPVEREEFPRLEIDPALLSVVCSELNHKRQQEKLPSITAELLEGADREILAGFYERGLDGLDPRVRAFVEDELITERGYRDSHALEDALDLKGVTAEALDKLVQHRLLRLDDRQSVRRLELTHDVLARVAKESRDQRRAREAEEAAKERERVAREQQWRNRRNAVWVGVGAVIVVALMVLAGWLALDAERARERNASLLREAESTRLTAIADRLQDFDYGVSLLVGLEAARTTPTLKARAGLLRRFVSHPHLSTILPAHKDSVNGVAFSPDGTQLASASGDRRIILWDVKSGKLLAPLEGHKKGVNGVAFSADGKLLASASWDKTVILWNVASRKPLAVLKGHTDGINGVAFSADGKLLASASEDHSVILWDVDSRKAKVRLKGHKGEVNGVAFSPNGRRLASASSDSTVILWDVASGKALARLLGHEGEVKSVAFSPNGKHLASAGGDQKVILWDVAGRKLVRRLEGHKAVVNSVAFSPNGRLLASASRDQAVIVWDAEGESHQRLMTLEGHNAEIFGVSFSPDGKRLATASRDQTAILWDLQGRKPLETLKTEWGSVNSVSFSPDGKLLAWASGHETEILPVARSRRDGAKLPGGHDATALCVAFSPDGKLLASAGKDQTVILWDARTDKPLATLKEHERAVNGLAFSPGGKLLASASWDGMVILWDLSSLRPRARLLRDHAPAVFGVAFSPDGRLLASASRDGVVILWDVRTGKPLTTLNGHNGTVNGVAFSPDGTMLASAGDDQAIVLWNVASGESRTRLRGHKGAVRFVEFSSDGKLLASASEDQTVMLWDVSDGQLLATLSGHESQVNGVAFRPDGKQLASASNDGTVILWNLDFGALGAEACRTANRNLTCDEWKSYVGADKSYRKTCEELPGPEKCD